MSKRKVTLFLVLFLLAFISPVAEANENDVLKLSLEDAVNMALEKNENLKIITEEYKKQRTKLEQITSIGRDFDRLEEGIDALRRGLSQIPQGHPLYEEYSLKLEGLYEKGNSAKLLFKVSASSGDASIRTINPMYIGDQVKDVFKPAAKISLEILDKFSKHTENQIKLLVINDYTEVLEKEKVVEARKLSLARAEKQMQLAKDFYEEGFRGKNDYLLAKIQKSKLKTDLLAAENDLESALLNLKRNIGIDLSQEIELTTRDFTIKEIEPDLEKDIKIALEKRPEVAQVEGLEEIQKLNFDFFSKIYTPNVYDYKLVKGDYEQAKYNTQIKRKDIEKEITNNYNTLLTAKSIYTEFKDNKELAKENLEIARIKYEEGLSSVIEVYTAIENLAQIEEGIIKAKRAVQLSECKYQVDLGPQN